MTSTKKAAVPKGKKKVTRSRPARYSAPMVEPGSYAGLFPGLVQFHGQKFVGIVYVDASEDELTLNAMTADMAAVFAAYLLGYALMIEPHRTASVRYVFEQTLTQREETRAKS